MHDIINFLIYHKEKIVISKEGPSLYSELNKKTKYVLFTHKRRYVIPAAFYKNQTATGK